MNNHMLLASVALFSLAVATPAIADDFNPQPDPPGRSKITQHSNNAVTTSTIGSATGGAGSGKSSIGSATGGAGSGKALVGHNAGGTQMHAATSAAATHGFNPQPDPPGKPATQTQTQ